MVSLIYQEHFTKELIVHTMQYAICTPKLLIAKFVHFSWPCFKIPPMSSTAVEKMQ